jgi:MFS family permease
MIISFLSHSILSFAISITLFGLSASIFYPISFSLVTEIHPLNLSVQNWVYIIPYSA